MAETIKLKEFLANEIRMRYAPHSILPYDDNRVLHSIVKGEPLSSEPIANLKIMNNNIIQMSEDLMVDMQPNLSADPESFACELTQFILDELDIRPTKEDLIKIRDKNIKLAVVGYGGAMINMLHNMFLWAREYSEFKLFDKIVIFEKDAIDFSNIPRLGKSVVSSYHPDYYRTFEQHAPNLKTLNKLSLVSEENMLSKENKIILFEQWLTDFHAEKLQDRDYVMVGAPTLDTRQMLSDKNFFFMGHGDFEVETTFQPQITSGLAMETYGTIDIPALLINLQLSTAAFIKQLAKDSDTNLEPGQTLFKFDIKEYIEKNAKKRG
jgi:hypothetical protein